ncbi:MAG: hypothetical protein ACRDYU_19845 [Actinomycetes bacterium]
MARGLVAGLLFLSVAGGPATTPRTLLGLAVAIRNLPVTAAAVVWGTAKGASPTLRDGLVVLPEMTGGHGPRATITFGSAVLTRKSDGYVSNSLLNHERRHSEQWALLGPVAFPAAYTAAEGAAGVWFGGHGQGNVFEIAAGLLEGGYDVGYMPPAARLASHWLAPSLTVGWRCRTMSASPGGSIPLAPRMLGFVGGSAIPLEPPRGSRTQVQVLRVPVRRGRRWAIEAFDRARRHRRRRPGTPPPAPAGRCAVVRSASRRVSGPAIRWPAGSADRTLGVVPG